MTQYAFYMPDNLTRQKIEMNAEPKRKFFFATIAFLFIVISGGLNPVSGYHVPADLVQETDQNEEKLAWTPEMQMNVKRVSNARISPSGRMIMFEVAQADLDADRWVRETNIVRIDRSYNNATNKFLPGCWDAQWGPGDSILFVRALDNKHQDRVHKYDLDKGVKEPITPEKIQVGWFHPSPAGDWLAFTTFEENRWNIIAISIDDGRKKEWNTPGSISGFSWSPTGDRIVAAYTPAGTQDWRQKSLVILDFAKDDPIPLKTGAGAAWMPQFGPDGRRIAFVASPGTATWMRDAELRILDIESGGLKTLARTPDRNIDLLAWHPNKKSLLGFEYEGSTRRLVSVPIDGDAAEYFGPDRSFNDAHISGERIAFTSECWDEPPEVYVAEWAKFDIKKVSQVHPKTAAPLGLTTTIRWQSDGGTEIEGLLTYPVGYKAGKRVPLLVRLHGGPPFPAADSFLGGTFMTAYPLASMASEGFAILQPNFRGSAGYGRKFRHELHTEWGAQDYRDVIAGVDALINQGVADPRRLGIMGWSYGGYLTAWTITQNDRFAAASMGAAMTDLAAFDKTTSFEGMLSDWFGGPSDDLVDRYRARSPITFAKGVRCPVLLQHGAKDTIVPIAQANMFAAELKKEGAKFKMSIYDFGHGPRKPCDELAILEQNLNWFKRILRDNEN